MYVGIVMKYMNRYAVSCAYPIDPNPAGEVLGYMPCVVSCRVIDYNRV